MVLAAQRVAGTPPPCSEAGEAYQMSDNDTKSVASSLRGFVRWFASTTEVEAHVEHLRPHASLARTSEGCASERPVRHDLLSRVLAAQ